MQVTAQLGLVLDLEYPTIFKQIMDALHPFVDFFHTLSVFTDVECAGLGSHTIRWLMKVVVVPSVLFLIAGLYYAYDVRKERQTAFMQFKSNAFFIVFFTCKSVLRLSVALLVMYRILNA